MFGGEPFGDVPFGAAAVLARVETDDEGRAFRRDQTGLAFRRPEAAAGFRREQTGESWRRSEGS